jgi:hypothetical protein
MSAHARKLMQSGGGWSMPSQSGESWERKAAQARHAAEILMGNSAKATMLEMADHRKLSHSPLGKEEGCAGRTGTSLRLTLQI